MFRASLAPPTLGAVLGAWLAWSPTALGSGPPILFAAGLGALLGGVLSLLLSLRPVRNGSVGPFRLSPLGGALVGGVLLVWLFGVRPVDEDDPVGVGCRKVLGVVGAVGGAAGVTLFHLSRTRRRAAVAVESAEPNPVIRALEWSLPAAGAVLGAAYLVWFFGVRYIPTTFGPDTMGLGASTAQLAQWECESRWYSMEYARGSLADALWRLAPAPWADMDRSSAESKILLAGLGASLGYVVGAWLQRRRATLAPRVMLVAACALCSAAQMVGLFGVEDDKKIFAKGPLPSAAAIHAQSQSMQAWAAADAHRLQDQAWRAVAGPLADLNRASSEGKTLLAGIGAFFGAVVGYAGCMIQKHSGEYRPPRQRPGAG